MSVSINGTSTRPATSQVVRLDVVEAGVCVGVKDCRVPIQM